MGWSWSLHHELLGNARVRFATRLRLALHRRLSLALSWGRHQSERDHAGHHDFLFGRHLLALLGLLRLSTLGRHHLRFHR
jgi:hypothetical protein